MPTKQLIDGTQYEKATHHKGKDLKGRWMVTLKIDGVRAIRGIDGSVTSRNSKPLYNLDHLEFTDAEIFRKDWNTSVSLVRSQSYKQITPDDVYQLRKGQLDPRLVTGHILVDPTYEDCLIEMNWALSQGYEGIVLRKAQSNTWLKVVPEITADVRVTGFEMSTKRIGWIKNFQTAHGNISATSFPEDELEEIRDDGAINYVGRIMEIGYREKTINGKARFAKFKRWRFDKNEESFT